MGQFEKIWTWKEDIAMDLIKLVEDSDSLNAATELNEKLQGKVQNILLFLQKLIAHPESWILSQQNQKIMSTYPTYDFI